MSLSTDELEFLEAQRRIMIKDYDGVPLNSRLDMVRPASSLKFQRYYPPVVSLIEAQRIGLVA